MSSRLSLTAINSKRTLRSAAAFLVYCRRKLTVPVFNKDVTFLNKSYININTYIYIEIHGQICFVLSELISVARQYLPVAGTETRLTQTSTQASNHSANEEILAAK